MVKQRGGSFSGGRDIGLAPTAAPAAAILPQKGGSFRRRNAIRRSHRRSRSRRGSKKGGCAGVISTAAVPFGLLALQRFFKGSRTSKRGLKNMGKSFKRTFRRRR